MTKKITDNQAFTGQLLSYNYYPDKKYLPSSAFRAVEYLDDGNIKIRIGDLEIATMPAELFSCFGLQIKKAMPVKCPVFWGYSNYSVGYLYNKEEAGKSFESAATDIEVGVPEEITEHLCEKVR